MQETEFFEIPDSRSITVALLMEVISSRCAGASEGAAAKDWSHYEDVDISVVRSSMGMPEAESSHNQVSDYLWEFTVRELADDYVSPDTNDDVEDIINVVSHLPIGRVPSHYFIKVTLTKEEQ